MQLLTTLLKDKKIILLLALAVLFGVIIFFLKSPSNKIIPIQQPSVSTSPKIVKTENQQSATIVEITKTGFFPQTIQIKKGSQVAWVNKDTKLHQIKSDPHPLDNLYPFLNTEEKLMTGEQVTIPFEKTGTFTYHDELNPLSFKGIIIVK